MQTFQLETAGILLYWTQRNSSTCRGVSPVTWSSVCWSLFNTLLVLFQYSTGVDPQIRRLQAVFWITAIPRSLEQKISSCPPFFYPRKNTRRLGAPTEKSARAMRAIASEIPGSWTSAGGRPGSRSWAAARSPSRPSPGKPPGIGRDRPGGESGR